MIKLWILPKPVLYFISIYYYESGVIHIPICSYFYHLWRRVHPCHRLAAHRWWLVLSIPWFLLYGGWHRRSVVAAELTLVVCTTFLDLWEDVSSWLICLFHFRKKVRQRWTKKSRYALFCMGTRPTPPKNPAYYSFSWGFCCCADVFNEFIIFEGLIGKTLIHGHKRTRCLPIFREQCLFRHIKFLWQQLLYFPTRFNSGVSGA